MGALDSARSDSKMFRGALCIAVHHHPGLPAAQVFALIARRSRLRMPRRPCMAQIGKQKILNASRLPCAVAGGFGNCPLDLGNRFGQAYATECPGHAWCSHAPGAGCRWLQRPPGLWYIPSMACAKWAIRLLRLSLSVGVMKPFSMVQGSRVQCTVRGTA